MTEVEIDEATFKPFSRQWYSRDLSSMKTLRVSPTNPQLTLNRAALNYLGRPEGIDFLTNDNSQYVIKPGASRKLDHAGRFSFSVLRNILLESDLDLFSLSQTYYGEDRALLLVVPDKSEGAA